MYLSLCLFHLVPSETTEKSPAPSSLIPFPTREGLSAHSGNFSSLHGDHLNDNKQ